MNSEPDKTDQNDEAQASVRKSASGEGKPSANADDISGPDKTEPAKGPDWQKRHYRVQVAAVIVGVAVAFIYGCQLIEMRKATDAATKAAEAASDGVKLAKENAHLEQRAWIGVDEIVNTPVVGQKCTVKVVCKNTGRTFASKVHIVTVVSVQPIWQIPDFEAGVEFLPTASNSLVPPEGTVNGSSTTDEITEDFMNKLETGESVIFVYGKITYDDVFNCHHWTTFCSQLAGDRTIGLSYRTYLSHNDADDGSNCE
ncbi:MAG: hypothetical protein M3R59_02975 [Verrucomicrobiota bacterium]|nr:hypothetical protein [Verrucomicrobiota bacterium]